MPSTGGIIHRIPPPAYHAADISSPSAIQLLQIALLKLIVTPLGLLAHLRVNKTELIPI